jgi:hypothetical protein
MGDLGRSTGSISISEKKIRNLGNGREKEDKEGDPPHFLNRNTKNKITFSVLETR